LVSLGEGSSNQGDFHEGLNFAGVHKLPVVILVENNKYAISVPESRQLACKRVSDRAIGYGMPGYTVDGSDVLEVYRVMKEAVERARAGGGPSLIETLNYRFTSHSSDDDDRTYRDEEERREAKRHDPILKFKAYLEGVGLLEPEKEASIRQKIETLVDEATEYAERAPYPKPEDALKYVYKEGGRDRDAIDLY